MDKEKDILIEQEGAEMPPVAEKVDSPEVSVTETTVSATPTSRTRKWMEERYPEESWADDDAFDEYTAKHLAKTDGKLSEYKESDDAIYKILEMYPDFALAINAMTNGMPPRVALRRYLGDVMAEPDPGDDDFEAYKEAAEKFLEEKKKADDEIATRTANLEKSDVLFTEFVESHFPTEAEQVAFAEYVQNAIRNMGMGEFSNELFDMMYKAYKHDTDVEDAKEAGAIEARNEKITAKRIKEKAETDGMPMGGGSSPIIEENMEEDDDFLGAAARRYRNREFK